MEIKILEILSIVSLIFSIIALFFNLTDIQLFMLFGYVLVISMMFLSKRLQGRRIVLLQILLIIPFFLNISWGTGLLTLFYTLTLLYYHTKVLGRIYLDDLITQFKLVYILMFLVTFLGLLISRINVSVIKSLPFMFLYFFTTIMLSSAVRNKAVGIDPKKNRQKLGLYLSLALSFSLILGVTQVRSTLLSGLSFLAEALQDILFFLIYPVIYVVSWLFTRVVSLISIPLNMEYEEEEVLGQIEEGVTQTAERVKESPIVEIILIGLVGFVLIFLTYRYIKAMTKKKESQLPYEERRDFMLESAKRKKKRRKDKLPSDEKGQFRYYYRQYLRRIDEKNPIMKNDTSLSIKEKSKNGSNKDEEIRELYIKYRYTENTIDADAVKKMKRLTEENS